MTGTTQIQLLTWDYPYTNYDDTGLEYLLACTGKDTLDNQLNWNHTIIPKINEGSETIHDQIVDDGDVPPRRELYLNSNILSILITTGYYNDIDETYCERYDVVIDPSIVEHLIYVTANQYYVQLDIDNYTP